MLTRVLSEGCFSCSSDLCRCELLSLRLLTLGGGCSSETKLVISRLFVLGDSFLSETSTTWSITSAKYPVSELLASVDEFRTRVMKLAIFGGYREVSVAARGRSLSCSRARTKNLGSNTFFLGDPEPLDGTEAAAACEGGLGGL